MRHVLGILTDEINSSLFHVLHGAPGDVPVLELVASAISILGKLDSERMGEALDAMGAFTRVASPDHQNQIVPLDGALQRTWWSDYPGDFFPWFQAAIEVNFFDFLGGLKRTSLGERIIAAQQKALENKAVQAAMAKYPEIMEIFPSLRDSAPRNIQTQDGGTLPSGGSGTSPPMASVPLSTSVSDGMP